jgi:hypothetical protein
MKNYKTLKISLFIVLIAAIGLGIYGCTAGNDAAVASGKGGSLARFAIHNDYLYTVGSRLLNIFDISDATNPVFLKEAYVGFEVETIFPHQNNLFFGTTTGMNVYSIQDPKSPVYLSSFSHARSCDPVVVEGRIAYVTLRGGGNCGAANDELNVIDMADLTRPVLIKSYPMSGPYGLGIDGNTLFVCDGNAGLRVFNAENPLDLKPIAHFTQINAYDVIPLNGNLLLIGNDGLFQYSYNNQNIQLLSKIAVNPD